MQEKKAPQKLLIHEGATCLVNAKSSFHTTILGLKIKSLSSTTTVEARFSS